MSEDEEALEILEEFCITRRNYWYRDSFIGLDGEVYDRYDVETTITCY
ncbi:hypothetical protein QO200_09735 [Flavobacterium sp. Arc3]